MDFILFMSILWIIYGVAGLLGFQNIPAKYEGYSWTIRYKRSSGIGWLIFVVPILTINLLIRIFSWPQYINLIMSILIGVISVSYSIYQEKKFNKLIADKQIELKDTVNT